MKKISFCFFNFIIFYFIFFFNLVISLVLCPILTLFIYFHFPNRCCFNGLDKWGLDAKSLIVQLVDTSWYFKTSKIQIPSPE